MSHSFIQTFSNICQEGLGLYMHFQLVSANKRFSSFFARRLCRINAQSVKCFYMNLHEFRSFSWMPGFDL